jgi:hypothetical protein
MNKKNLVFYLFGALTLIFCSHIKSLGNSISLENVKEFIPKSAITSEIRLFVGDLNRDRVEDAFLRFKVLNEPKEQEHFYLFIASSYGQLNLIKKDIFRFDHKNGMVFDTVTISDGDFTIKYSDKENNYGSYRLITFNFRKEGTGNYWILHRDEELFQHKVYAPAPQKAIVVTKSEMRDSGGEFFGNINENLYDVMLRMKIKDYIPDSISECSAYSGDLNRDIFDDILLRFKIKNEYETYEHYYLFLGQNNGTYKLTAKNDSLELDNANGTTFDKITIKNGYFSLEYIGYGNTSGSYNIYTFKYSEKDQNWLLHRIGSKILHRYFTKGDPPENISTQKDFGKILFEEYR